MFWKDKNRTNKKKRGQRKGVKYHIDGLRLRRSPPAFHFAPCHKLINNAEKLPRSQYGTWPLFLPLDC